MISYIIILLKIISFILGIVLIYTGLFLYENEEKKLNNSLENIWIVIDDTSKSAITFHKRLILTISKLILSKLELIFGNKLLSFQAISVSYFLSFFSLLFVFGIICFVGSYIESDTEDVGIIGIILIIISLLFLKSSLIIHKWSKLKLIIKIAIIAVFIFSFLIIALHMLFSSFFYNDSVAIFAVTFAILFTILTDFLFIIINIKVLRYTSTNEKSSSSILLLIINALLIITIVIIPFFLSDHILDNTNPANPIGPGSTELLDIKGKYGSWGYSLGSAIVLIPFSSLPAVVISASFFLILCLLYLHKMFWPLLARPLYAFQRNGIVKYKKALIALGILLIGWLFPDSILLLKNILKNL